MWVCELWVPGARVGPVSVSGFCLVLFGAGLAFAGLSPIVLLPWLCEFEIVLPVSSLSWLSSDSSQTFQVTLA